MIDNQNNSSNNIISTTYTQKGLNNIEVMERAKLFGQNKLPEKEGRRPLSIFLTQFKNPLIYIITLAAIISVVLTQYDDAIIITVVIILDTIVGFLQEYRAQKTVETLKKLLKPTTHVIRNGIVDIVEVTKIVPDDLIILNVGDRVPADGELIEAVSLNINEAILTGESEPIVKNSTDMSFMGTTILTGRGLMKVTTIGMASKLGKIALSLSDIKDETTPLQQRLDNFSKTLTYLVIIISAFIFITGIITGENILEMLRMTVVLAIAAIPEGLLIAVTIILVIGMRAILKRNGLVKKLLAVETLGSVSTIATDKTGTLTEGVMKVVKTDFQNDEMAINTMILCNNLGNSVASALWEYVVDQDIDPQILNENHSRVYEIPFTSEKKYMLTTNRMDGVETGFLKGAPDIIIDYCALDVEERQRISTKCKEWGEMGLKLLALAYKNTGNPRELTEFTWAGLIGIEDPVRPSVRDAIVLCHQAGIKIKMITGDYRGTAIKVASNLGLAVGSQQILEGNEIEALTDEELIKIVKNIVIFCRVTPQHKLKIINALQRSKEVTAMIGDGVNDAPALKKANIGVSVGSGTDVAQETASLILLDNNFATLVDAVEEGRVIFDNIKKVVAYVISNSFIEIFIIFGAFILGWPTPLTVAQILWIHLICDGPSDIALGFEPKEKGIMDEPPKKLKEKILDKESLILILSINITSAIICLAFFTYYYTVTGNILLGRTMIFAILSLQELIYIFSFRSFRHSIFNSGNLFSNKVLIYSVLLGIGQLLCALYIPYLRNVLDLVDLDWKHWIIVMLIAFGMTGLVEIVKYVSERVQTLPLKQIFANISRAEKKFPEIETIHNVTVDILKDKTLIQFHIGLLGDMELNKAHKIVSNIEDAIKMEFSESQRANLVIVSHIEPTSKLPAGHVHSHLLRPIPTDIQEIISNTISNYKTIQTWNLMNVIIEEGLTSISIRLYLEGSMDVIDVHHITEELESDIRKKIPYLKRCFIHTEPIS